MTTGSAIEWTDHTFNPWIGCQNVGPGCDHCYAEAMVKRFGGEWGPHSERRKTKQPWHDLLRWERNHEAFEAEHGRRQRVFCGSMCDIFDNAPPIEWTKQALAHLYLCKHLNFQLLTKRVGNVETRFPKDWLDGTTSRWPQNAGLMITVVNQDEADRDIPQLLALKAQYHIPWVGLSMEPLLGPVQLDDMCDGYKFVDALRGNWWHDEPRSDGRDAISRGHPRLDWIITGGESGPHARPAHPDWFRSLRDQCAAAGTAFFFKQWGAWGPHRPQAGGDLGGDVRSGKVTTVHPTGESDVEVFDRTNGHNTIAGTRYMIRLGKKAAGRRLDGRTHDEFPEELQ